MARARGGSEERRPVRGRSGPPRLKLGLLHKLKVLLLANILPLLMGAWLVVAWYRGQITLDTGRLGSDGALAMVVLVLCCAMLTVSSWFVMPLARWVRDYPRWHYRHASPSVWAVPMVLGYGFWLAIWIAMALCAIIAVALMFTGLWFLAEKVGLVGDGEAQPEPPAAEAGA